MRKIVATLTAIVVAVLLTGGLLAPAQAGTAALPKHKITASSERINNHKYVISGRATLKGHKFVVLKKAPHHKYGRYLTPKTKANGTFKFTVTGNLGDCFAMVFPGDGKHRATAKPIGCIQKQ